MQPIKQTDLQEKREQEKEQNQLPVSVDSLGTALVQERIARMKVENKAKTLGIHAVKQRLDFLRQSKGGLS